MDFNFESKKNTGIVVTLILIILLSQSKFFNFLINTALGRSVLILLILGISYTNKILGVVSVLFIIIAFNQSELTYLEGYTGNTKENTNDTKKKSIDVHHIEYSNPVEKPINEQSASEQHDSREGFNNIDREGMILKGKRANEIPVFSNVRNQSENIEPADESSFNSSYTSF
jgi:hypothetical protein